MCDIALNYWTLFETPLTHALHPPPLAPTPGDGIRHTIMDRVTTAETRVKPAVDNVAGVKLPRFEVMREGGEASLGKDLTGLGVGGQQVNSARKTFVQSVKLLVELASLQVRAGLLLGPFAPHVLACFLLGARAPTPMP